MLRILLLAVATCSTAQAGPIRVAVVQMAEGPAIAQNRDRIVSWIPRAAAERARVVVFPEAALRSGDATREAEVEQALGAIREAAHTHGVYVVFGGWTPAPKLKKNANWMRVVDPSGAEIFRYDKIYDDHRAAMPGVFALDGVPAGAIICADRWLRGVEELPIQQGARISIELSNNFASEWVPAFEWYWNVPRAPRNNVWVIFANSASGAGKSGHGHSAIIAPDGRIVASVADDRETMIVADIDPALATRTEALARHDHPVVRKLWETTPGASVRFQPLESPARTLKIAAAQVTGIDAVEAMIREAGEHGADLVAFPEQAISGGLERIRAAARARQIHVVVGMAEGRHNSAFAIGPDGAVLTRYDQLAATAPFEPGTSFAPMWFRIKGVPAVLTIGRDGLWTEIAELAAVAGAQVHIHLTNEPPGQRLLQVWSNLASYVTFTATVSAQGGSALWDDLKTLEERRAVVKGTGNKDVGDVEVFSPFSANLVVRAGNGPEIIYASRTIPKRNPYHPARTTAMNPEMKWWYEQGAMLVMPAVASAPSTAGAPSERSRFPGRIAWSSDGNHNDPDDWAASPVALAIFAACGARDRLVHFDYNCILPKTDPEWERAHAQSVLGAAERYGYDRTVFHDCRKDLDGAVESIARAINDSSANNPLYLVIAGPVEVSLRGILKADREKRKYVYCISHSRWNDGYAASYSFTETKRSVIPSGIHWVQIRDQNRLLSTSPYGREAKSEQWQPYQWMRDADDPKLKFLWERLRVSTRPDPSDAGMAYFLMTGDEEADPAKLERLLAQHVVPAPVQARTRVRLEAENFRDLDDYDVEDRKDKGASHALDVKLAGGTTGRIVTSFDEPYTAKQGRYDVEVRYFDEAEHPSRFTLLINGAARGESWESPGRGQGWTTQIVHDLEIRTGDEIAVRAQGPPGRIDYVQLNSRPY